MGQIAETEEDFLYKLFGIDAELLIDHAWGRETTTMADIKNYKPKANCLSSGQVLSRDYEHEEGKLIVKEMTDLLCLDLVDKDLVTESATLYMGYANRYGKESARGTVRFPFFTCSAQIMLPYMEELYDRIKDKSVPIRRINITFNNVEVETYRQYDLFTDPVTLEKERNMQKAMLNIKRKFGKNAILKGMNLEESATTMERNRQIGGHKSGD